MSEQVYGWDTPIHDEPRDEFVTLPAGTEIDFRIIKFDRGFTSDQRAPMALIELIGEADAGTTYIRDRIALTSRSAWKIAALFRSVGLAEKGEEFVPQWDALVGMTGRARVTLDTWTGRDGVERKDNKIDRYIDPPATHRGDGAPVDLDEIEF